VLFGLPGKATHYRNHRRRDDNGGSKIGSGFGTAGTLPA
jgi:hypothetical protein